MKKKKIWIGLGIDKNTSISIHKLSIMIQFDLILINLDIGLYLVKFMVSFLKKKISLDEFYKLYRESVVTTLHLYSNTWV